MGLVRHTVESGDNAVERRDHNRDSAGLQAQLRTGGPDGRRRAAMDLWGDESALAALLEARIEESDPLVRDAIITSLTGFDVPEVGRSLAVDLRSEDAALRNAVVKALQTMPRAMEAVVGDGILVDDDADVRILAIMVLSGLAHPDVPNWVRPLVHTDSEPNVVAAAVDLAVTIDPDLAVEFSAVAAARFPNNPYLAYLASESVRA